MKPFDLEAAKRGEPIQTRDGRPVKFIAYVPEADKSQRVVVLVDGYIVALHEDGSVHDDCNHYDDIFMAPRKRTVWVNLHPYAGKSSYGYPATVYATKEMADAVSDQDRQGNRAWPLEIEE
jgi:hypothetical protein